MKTRTENLDKCLKNEGEKEIPEGKRWLQMFTVNSYKLCSSDLGQCNCSKPCRRNKFQERKWEIKISVTWKKSKSVFIMTKELVES